MSALVEIYMVIYSSDILVVDTVLYKTLCFSLRYVQGCAGKCSPTSSG